MTTSSCSVPELRALLRDAAEERARVSVFLSSPEDHGFATLKTVPLALREAEERAERDLARVGMDEAARRRLLGRLAELRERIGAGGSSPAALPPLPWTLAYLLDDGRSRMWSFATRIPALAAPMVAVTRTPRVLPLLEALDGERSFHVLAVSVNRVALLEGDARRVRAIDAPGVPASLEDALGEELESPEDLQFHTTGTGRAGAARRAVAHHGQGGAPAEREVDLERFHRVVASAVSAHLRTREKLPLVLLADTRHQTPLQDRLARSGFAPRGVVGSPERLSERQIHDEAWPVIRAHVSDERAANERALGDARGDRRRFREGLAPLAETAVQGRIERLWIGADATHPGRISEPGGEVAGGWPGEDALDQLAALVLRHGGAVHVLARGAEHPVAGLLRG